MCLVNCYQHQVPLELVVFQQWPPWRRHHWGIYYCKRDEPGPDNQGMHLPKWYFPAAIPVIFPFASSHALTVAIRISEFCGSREPTWDTEIVMIQCLTVWLQLLIPAHPLVPSRDWWSPQLHSLSTQVGEELNIHIDFPASVAIHTNASWPWRAGNIASSYPGRKSLKPKTCCRVAPNPEHRPLLHSQSALQSGSSLVSIAST